MMRYIYRLFTYLFIYIHKAVSFFSLRKTQNAGTCGFTAGLLQTQPDSAILVLICQQHPMLLTTFSAVYIL